jgi:ribonuclease VapC
MIALDTSALMEIALNEKEADACIAALEAGDDVLISAGRGQTSNARSPHDLFR